MNLPRTVSDVLAEHTLFEIECIDRMYLNVYVPQLQYPAGIVGYVNRQLGLPIASTAPLGRITDAFSAAMRRYAADCAVPWVDFVKGQRKDDVMHQHLARFEAAGGSEGVLFIGRAQEKAVVFRTEKRHNAQGHAYPWIVRTTAMVNHFYVYAVDADFGPFFLKFCAYFPYNARLCLNGNEWAKKQAAKAGIGFTALDNAFAGFDDPGEVARVRQPRARGHRRPAAQVAGQAAPPVLPGRPGRGLPLRPVDPASGVLPDPHARPSGHRKNLLRTGHPRQPRHRPARTGLPDLQPQNPHRQETPYPGPVPHQGHHRGSHPQPARGLQPKPPSTTPTTSASAND
jgi:hypothetical protein